MRVVQIARGVPPELGGIQAHVAAVSRELAEQGFDVHVVVGSPGSVPGAEVHVAPSVPLPGLTLGYYASLSLAAGVVADRLDPDIVHGHSMYGAGYALVGDAPFVSTLHTTQLEELRIAVRTGDTVNNVVTHAGSTLMEAWAMRRSDHVMAVSRAVADDGVRQYGLDPDRVDVVPNGTDPDSFRVGSRDEPVVLALGRLHRRKGFGRLIRAFADVQEQIPEAELVIVGKGDHRERLERLAEEVGAADAVRFTGYLPDDELIDAYASASVFANPSLYEGFELVTLDAMAAGLPVVATPNGAAPALIEDGVTGQVVRDVDELAEALVDLLGDLSNCRSMGANARKQIEESWTWEAISRRVADVYRRVLNGDEPAAATGSRSWD